jgi:glycosyltransferase involved in cell wall biosynthesis
MRVMAIMRLADAKAQDKLLPLLRSPLVERLIVVRHSAVDVEMSKLVQVVHDVGLKEPGERQRPLSRLHNVWACLWNGLRISRRERPDLVWGIVLLPYGLVAWLVARLTGVPVVLSLIGTDYNKQVRKWWGRVLLPILHDYDAVTVFSQEGRGWLIEHGLEPSRVFLFPNCVNIDRYYPETGTVPDIDLVYVGQLVDFKRVDLLLHALRLVRMERPRTRLLIVGDGPERGALERLAQELSLDDAAHFIGWSDQVADLLRRARTFVSLSETEGLPMAMLEAMSTGLPPVVTDVGAVGSVVRDGENGYLLPSPADPALVAERVLRLLNDQTHYQQLHRAACEVRRSHAYERATGIWTELLTKIPASKQRHC